MIALILRNSFFVAETSRCRNGGHRNVPSPKRRSPKWRRRMGVAETASPKRSIPIETIQNFVLGARKLIRAKIDTKITKVNPRRAGISS